MSLRVVVPPEPFLTPGAIPGTHAADDANVAAIIAAVTAEIDGPTGWLGICLGEQTLELVGPGYFVHMGSCHGVRLPCPPFIEVLSVKYLDDEAAEQVVPDTIYRVADGYLVTKPHQHWPDVGCFADGVRIRYRAGHNGVPIADGGTGDVPAAAIHAVTMSVQHMLSLGAENLFLRSEEVEGIGTTQYTVSDQASNIIRSTSERLLQGLRIFA